MSILNSIAAEISGTARHRAICFARVYKCGSVSTVFTLVSSLLPGDKTQTSACAMILEAPHDCCDAGAGSCIRAE